MELFFFLIFILCKNSELHKIYQYSNFSLLGIEYIESLEFEPELLDYYRDYKLEDDPEYTSDKENYDEIIKKYSKIVE